MQRPVCDVKPFSWWPSQKRNLQLSQSMTETKFTFSLFLLFTTKSVFSLNFEGYICKEYPQARINWSKLKSKPSNTASNIYLLGIDNYGFLCIFKTNDEL